MVNTFTPRQRIANRLVKHRYGVARRAEVAKRSVGAVVLDDEEIDAEDAPVFSEGDLRAAGHVRTAPADKMLFFAGDAHHDWCASLFREQCRDRHRNRPTALAAEPTAAVFGNENQIGRLDCHPVGDVVDRANDALRRCVDMQLAVEPVRHRAARLHWLMRGGLHDEGLIEHERRVFECRVEIAELPFLGRFAHRQTALALFGEIGVGPFQCLYLGTRRSLARRARIPDVAQRSRAWPTRPQAFKRIDDEWKRFPLNFDHLDGVGRGELIDGRHRRDGFSLIVGLVGQRPFGSGSQRRFRRRQIVGRQNRLDPRHGQRPRGIDPSHARMRQWTEKQLAEQHAFCAKVFGVLGRTHDLRDQVGRDVVGADVFERRHQFVRPCAWREYSAPRINAVRILL